jgi:ketosteroid isomerase-like protein
MTGEEVAVVDQALTDFIRSYHSALNMFFAGNPEPAKQLYSRREDASLGNPFGPFEIGWPHVEAAMERAAANYREGRATGFESVATHVTPDLAYLLEVERFEAKVGGAKDFVSGALRVTSVLRLEDGHWKVVHRHADPITTPRAAASVVPPE